MIKITISLPFIQVCSARSNFSKNVINLWICSKMFLPIKTVMVSNKPTRCFYRNKSCQFFNYKHIVQIFETLETHQSFESSVYLTWRKTFNPLLVAIKNEARRVATVSDTDSKQKIVNAIKFIQILKNNR